MSRKRKTMNPWVRLGLLLFILLSLVTGVIYFVIKRNDEAEESNSAAAESTAFNVITLWENDPYDIVRVTAVRKDSTVTMYSSLDEYEIQTWYQEEYPNRKLNAKYSYLLGIAEKATAYDIIRENPTAEDLAIFGLAEPSVRLEYELEDGTVRAMLIGDLNLKENYCYVMIEGEDVIYSTSYLYRDYAMVTTEELYYLDIDQILYTDNFVYAQFIKKGGYVIWLMGYDNKEDFQQNYASAQTNIRFYSPMDYRTVIVRGDLLENVLNNDKKEYIATSGVVNINATEEELAAYGLSAEASEYYIHMLWAASSPNSDGSYNMYESEYFFGVDVPDQPGYVYFRQGSDNMVYAVTKASLEQYSFEPMDYCEKYVFLSNYKYVDELEVAFEGENYFFDLTHYTKENGVDAYTVTCNGKDINLSDFTNNVFSELLTLSGSRCIWQEEVEHREDDYFFMTYTQRDGTVREIKIYRYDDFSYVVKMQENMWFVCDYYQFDLVKTNLRELIK